MTETLTTAKTSKIHLGVLEHSVRTAVAAVASYLVARWCQLPEAYWAPITTMVITQSSVGAAFKVSWNRIIGTAFGAGMGALIATYLPQSLWVFAAAIFALGLICALAGVDRSAYRFGGVTIAVVLLIQRTAPAWKVALHRFLEVSIGIAVALILATVWPEGEEPATGK